MKYKIKISTTQYSANMEKTAALKAKAAVAAELKRKGLKNVTVSVVQA